VTVVAERLGTSIAIGDMTVGVHTFDDAFLHMLRDRYAGFIGSAEVSDFEFEIDLTPPADTAADDDVRVFRKDGRWHLNETAGFLLNSDVSRVSLVSETGESLSEEFTFPLVADAWLAGHPGVVVTNFSTSRMIEDVAAARQSPIVRTKVGQSHAIQALLQEEGVLAGEGSGGVAIPAFQPAFDGFLTMGHILETLARSGKRLSALVGALPRYHIVKEKIYCPPSIIHSVVDAAKALFHGRALDTGDGLRAEDRGGWVQVRISATEPMIRVIAEDRNKERARAKADEILHEVELLIR